MYNNYTFNQEGNIVVNDENKLCIKENHNEVVKELGLENQIEILKNKRLEMKKIKDSNPSEKKNRHRKRKINFCNIMIGVATIFLCKIIIPLSSLDYTIYTPYFWVKSASDALLTVFMLLYLPCSIIAFIINEYIYSLNRKSCICTDILFEELNEQILEKEEELEKIRQNKQGKINIDTNIHKIETNDFLGKIEKQIDRKEELILKYLKLKRRVRIKNMEEVLVKKEMPIEEQEFVRKLDKKIS